MPELTCEQVNERLAALCHWYIIEVDVMNGGFGEADGPVTREVRWQKGARTSPYYRERTTPPDYCHDINACAEAEREIAEWGLGSKYAVAIGRMLNPAPALLVRHIYCNDGITRNPRPCAGGGS